MLRSRMLVFARSIAAFVLLVAPNRADVARCVAPVEQEPRSFRMETLEKDVRKGNGTAAAEFWSEIKQRGTPLIEADANDPKNRIVTFLWRGDSETRNVVVFAGFNENVPEKNRFRNIDGTDVWFKTYRVPSNARFAYFLSPNDPLIPFQELDPKEIGKRAAGFRLDPLNRTGAIGGGSAVELPDAPPQPWIVRKPDIARGQLSATFEMSSTILNNKRRAWVYTPPGYDQASDRMYPLIVMLDGPMYTLLIPTPTILDNLCASGQVPPMIALILDNPTPSSRDTEFACYEPFAEFLVKEAVPWVRSLYRVTTDAGRTFISGVSYGGLAAAYVGLRHSEVFGNIICQSGSFWFKPDGEAEPEWLARQFANGSKLPLRFHLDVGLLERGPTPGGAPDMVTVSRHMRDVLVAKSYFVDYREYVGGHEALNWRGLLPEALIALSKDRAH